MYCTYTATCRSWCSRQILPSTMIHLPKEQNAETSSKYGDDQAGYLTANRQYSFPLTWFSPWPSQRCHFIMLCPGTGKQSFLPSGIFFWWLDEIIQLLLLPLTGSAAMSAVFQRGIALTRTCIGYPPGRAKRWSGRFQKCTINRPLRIRGRGHLQIHGFTLILHFTNEQPAASNHPPVQL